MAITADSLPENPNKTQATVGKDYFLKVNTGTYESPTWTLVGGQRNSKLGKKADSIDVSDKTTGGWSAKMPGLKSWTIDLSGLVMLNDDGVDALNAAFDASKMVDVRLEYPDKTFQRGWAAITEFDLDNPHNGAATLTGKLEGNGPLSARAKDTTNPSD